MTMLYASRRASTRGYLDEVDPLPPRRVQTPVNTEDNRTLADLINEWDANFPERTIEHDEQVQTGPTVMTCLVGDSGQAIVWRGTGHFNLAWHQPTSLSASVRVLDAAPEPQSTPHIYVTEAVSVDSPSADVIGIVDWVQRVLGVTERDVLHAAGIRLRTYYNWKGKPETAPRLGSQADLWGLAQSVESIADDLGESAVQWMKTEPARRELLAQGAHTRLAALATAELARRGEYDDPDSPNRSRPVPVGRDD